MAEEWLNDRRPPNQNLQTVQAMLNLIQGHIDTCRLKLNNIEAHRVRCTVNGDPVGETNHAVSHSHGPNNGNPPRQQAYDEVKRTLDRMPAVITALTNAMPTATPFGLDHGGGGVGGPLGITHAVQSPEGPKTGKGKGKGR